MLDGFNLHHVTTLCSTHKSTVRQNGCIERRIIFHKNLVIRIDRGIYILTRHSQQLVLTLASRQISRLTSYFTIVTSFCRLIILKKKHVVFISEVSTSSISYRNNHEFILVRNYLKKAKKRHRDISNISTKYVDFKV